MPQAKDPTQPQLAHSKDSLFLLFYKDLKAVAGGLLSRERPGHTLQPTALVNEVFLRLSQQKITAFQSKNHFMAVGAMMMRRILVDGARRTLSMKRNSRGWNSKDWASLQPGLSAEELIDLDQSLSRLSQLDPRQSQMIELRFFAGFSTHELAEAFNLSVRTVEYDLQMAKAWLLRDMKR